ncbi:MAG: hypothetical protein AB7F89_16050 [Pirellulaceae bacterium]
MTATAAPATTGEKNVVEKSLDEKSLDEKNVAAKKTSTAARTYGEVASHFGVSRDTVRQAWKTAGMPKLPCRWELLEAWHETLRKKPDKETEAASEEVTTARRQKIQADARRAEARATIELHKARQLDTSLVEIESVERFLSELFVSFRTALLRLPGEVAAAYPIAWRETLAGDLRDRCELVLRGIHGRASELAEIRDES